jgi:hypothetical protein
MRQNLRRKASIFITPGVEIFLDIFILWSQKGAAVIAGAML